MPPFNAINDPLGQLINLQAQVRQRRFADAVANPATQTTGPLPDPQWDAYFEAVDQANPGKKTTFDSGGDLPNSPALKGLQAAAPAAPSDTDPNDRAVFYPNTGADAKLLAARQKKGLK